MLSALRFCHTRADSPRNAMFSAAQVRQTTRFAMFSARRLRKTTRFAMFPAERLGQTPRFATLSVRCPCQTLRSPCQTHAFCEVCCPPWATPVLAGQPAACRPHSIDFGPALWISSPLPGLCPHSMDFARTPWTSPPLLGFHPTPSILLCSPDFASAQPTNEPKVIGSPSQPVMSSRALEAVNQ